MELAKWFKGIRLSRPPAAASPPAELPAPERVYLPLRQHRGSMTEPQVRPGDMVGVGQVVGASEEFDAALVHSPVSGKVAAVDKGYDPEGKSVPVLVIDNDGNDTWHGEEELPAPLSNLDELLHTRPTRLLRRVRQAGLVRAEAAGLPLQVELSPPMAPRSYLFMTGIPVVRQIDTLIIRCVDADPPVTPNQAALAGLDRELEQGVAALARISGARRVIFALPGGAQGGMLAELAASHQWERASVSQTHFPYATDNLIIKELTGRDVPTPYGEPRDVGVVIEPLLTAMDVGRVMATGRPPITRVVSVAGDVGAPQAFRVRLGTPIGEVIKAAGGIKGEMGKIVLGGPMMGLAHFDLNTPVTKEVGGIFVQNAAAVKRFSDLPCINCGRCVGACPVNLIPSELGKLCEFGQFEEAGEKDLLHCIECGCCAYVCPARRPMVHYLRLGKIEVMAGRAEE